MNNETPCVAVDGGRRRMLGAIALATSPVLASGAALAGPAPGLSAPGPHSPPAGAHPLPIDSAPVSAGGSLHLREGWLLAQSDG